MKNNELSELEIKLYNATIKFLNKIIEEERYNGCLEAVIKKSENKYRTFIGLHSCISEKISHNCSLKYYENLGQVKIYFTPESEEKPYDKKYKEFILKEIPECKDIEIIED